MSTGNLWCQCYFSHQNLTPIERARVISRRADPDPSSGHVVAGRQVARLAMSTFWRFPSSQLPHFHTPTLPSSPLPSLPGLLPLVEGTPALQVEIGFHRPIMRRALGQNFPSDAWAEQTAITGWMHLLVEPAERAPASTRSGPKLAAEVFAA